MKTQYCDKCRHGTIRVTPKPALVCAMLHKPRFYAPLYLMKDTWGWKRKCEDFAQKDENRAEDNADVVSRALRMAWHLGQTYWQQADSEYTSQHRKADETQGKFRALVDETRSKILSLSANPPKPEPAPRRQGPAP